MKHEVPLPNRDYRTALSPRLVTRQPCVFVPVNRGGIHFSKSPIILSVNEDRTGIVSRRIVEQRVAQTSSNVETRLANFVNERPRVRCENERNVNLLLGSTGIHYVELRNYLENVNFF